MKMMVCAAVGSCMAVAAAFVGVAAGDAQAAEGANSASPWIELHNARVRLLSGPSAAKTQNTKAFLAGVEVKLADGWKTYWRMPGDAGVPPNFDWAGSTNIGSITVRYPAP